ncbi:MAG: hypothetical protein ACJA1C_000231 [Crocinitomicaceae bacterium]|jgi:hypothetical protein
MTYVIVLNSFVIHFVYVFDLSKYLVDSPWKKISTSIALTIVFIGVIFLIYSDRLPKTIATFISCLFPICHLILYSFLHTKFMNKYHRKPTNVFNGASRNSPDITFANFLFFTLIVSFAKLVPFLWGTAKT